MISYISASYIFPVTSDPIKDGVVGISPDGTIREILTAEEAEAKGIATTEHHEGLLVPGFINTHCHLELSHMHGKIDQHTGLPGFVQQVIQQRQADDTVVIEAMKEADQYMYDHGIVAVGDISNKLISKTVKENSRIYYHTFIEAMGFNPVKATDIINAARELKKDFAPLPASIVPHAPYSVSDELFNEIRLEGVQHDDLISIHNQETPDENAFFAHKTGSFLNLYQFLGLNIDFFKASGKTSLQTYLPKLSATQKTLLVHNTFTNKEDLDFAGATHSELYWCLCPNANLYIENKLPDTFKDVQLRITLGTDSLASNQQLSIVEEMRTLQENWNVSFDQLLSWATINGAGFLGLEDRFGSLTVGKAPGINLLGFTEGQDGIRINGMVKRLY